MFPNSRKPKAGHKAHKHEASSSIATCGCLPDMYAPPLADPCTQPSGPCATLHPTTYVPPPSSLRVAAPTTYGSPPSDPCAMPYLTTYTPPPSSLCAAAARFPRVPPPGSIARGRLWPIFRALPQYLCSVRQQKLAATSDLPCQLSPIFSANTLLTAPRRQLRQWTSPLHRAPPPRDQLAPPPDGLLQSHIFGHRLSPFVVQTFFLMNGDHPATCMTKGDLLHSSVVTFFLPQLMRVADCLKLLEPCSFHFCG